MGVAPFFGIPIWIVLFLTLISFFDPTEIFPYFTIIYVAIVYFFSFGEIKADLDNLKKRIEDELEAAKIEATKIINRAESEAKIISNEIELRKTFAEKDEETWKAALKETSKGFPTLFKAIQEFERHRDRSILFLLRRWHKSCHHLR